MTEIKTLFNRAKIHRKLIAFLIAGFLLFLLLATYSSSKGVDKRMAQSCIFCDIINGKFPDTKLEVETSEYVIFKDIKPASEHHYLAVPKQHFESLKVLNKSQLGLIMRMEEGLKKMFTSKGISTTDALFGFHLPPFISVKHLHMHAIAPRSEMGFLSRFMFKPSTMWFKTVDEAQEYLNQKEL